MKHRWSGWPGAFCLDCGLEDATELELAAEAHNETHHRYSPLPHTKPPCEGCTDDSRPCRLGLTA